jgi:NAD(P)-dependent dehydrogenase (short-subunit alcohol dehydrogenase family)
MSSSVLIVGGGSGIGLEFAKLALRHSEDSLVLFDRAFISETSTLLEAYPHRVIKVSSEIDENVTWDPLLMGLQSVSSLVFICPSCRSRDYSVSELGYSNNFCHNISSVNMSLLKLITSIRSRLLKDSNLVFISSILSTRVAVSDASLDYHASKAVLDSIMRFMAVKLAPQQVRVNCVSPGLIARGPTSSLITDPETSARVSVAVPLGRPCTAAEVAQVVWSLCSGSLPYISGHVLTMDGAMSALEPFALTSRNPYSL